MQPFIELDLIAMQSELASLRRDIAERNVEVATNKATDNSAMKVKITSTKYAHTGLAPTPNIRCQEEVENTKAPECAAAAEVGINPG